MRPRGTNENLPAQCVWRESTSPLTGNQAQSGTPSTSPRFPNPSIHVGKLKVSFTEEGLHSVREHVAPHLPMHADQMRLWQHGFPVAVLTKRGTETLLTAKKTGGTKRNGFAELLVEDHHAESYRIDWWNIR
jgi:hypothetical protein